MDEARWSLRRLEAAVEGFSTQLQCPICLCAFDAPVSLPCNHCFCEECIHRALELKQVCPICKLPAKKRRLRYDQMIRQLLAATELLCAPAPASEAPMLVEDAGGAVTTATVTATSTRPATPPLVPLSVVRDSSVTSNDTVELPGSDHSSGEGEVEAPSDWLARTHEVDDIVADSEATGAIEDPPTQAMHEAATVPRIEEGNGGASAPLEAVANAPAAESAAMPVDADAPVIAPAAEPVIAPAAEAASAPAVEVEAPPLNGPFGVGDLVEVTDRTWAGINKPGGTARITSVNDDGTYGVKYVLSARREHSVHDFFIHRPPDELVSDGTPSRAVKKRQRRSVAESPLSSGRSSAPSSDKKRAKRPAASATPSPVRSTPDKPKRADMILLCSGFEDADTEEITEWATQLGAEVVPQWSSAVTHLIAKCVRSDGSQVDGPFSLPSRRKSLTPSGKRKLFADGEQQKIKAEELQLRDCWVKTRSLKYLKAITAGRWIVTEHWLRACVEQGDRVDESPFEADGHFKGRRLHDSVRLARLAREASLRTASPSVDASTVGTQLFSAFCFHIVGEFLPPMPLATEVESLLLIGGGKIIRLLDDIPREMRRQENRGRRLVVVCDKINPHALSKEIKRLSALRQLQDPSPQSIVNYHWVINSISDAKLREFPDI